MTTPIVENSAGEASKALGLVAQFLGHSLAAALGFAGLAVIALIPIGITQLIKAWGDPGLASSLHWLEITLFAVDIALFLVVFLAGAVIFAVEVYVDTRARIIEILGRRLKP